MREQDDSSRGVFGVQTKILRRLAVSAAPFASKGPSIVTWPDVRIELEPRNLTRRVHRPLERPVQLRARQVVGRDEGHADGVQPRVDRDPRRGLAVARRALDLLVPVEQLHALAVDGDFELLARDLPRTAWK